MVLLSEVRTAYTSTKVVHMFICMPDTRHTRAPDAPKPRCTDGSPRSTAPRVSLSALPSGLRSRRGGPGSGRGASRAGTASLGSGCFLPFYTLTETPRSFFLGYAQQPCLLERIRSGTAAGTRLTAHARPRTPAFASATARRDRLQGRLHQPRTRHTHAHRLQLRLPVALRQLQRRVPAEGARSAAARVQVHCALKHAHWDRCTECTAIWSIVCVALDATVASTLWATSCGSESRSSDSTYLHAHAHAIRMPCA